MRDGLYLVKYYGNEGSGFGFLHVSGTVVTGAASGGIIFRGSCRERGNRLQLEGTLFNSNLAAEDGGTALVVGRLLLDGQTIHLSADLPVEFDDGRPHDIMLNGVCMPAKFEKIEPTT